MVRVADRSAANVSLDTRRKVYYVAGLHPDEKREKVDVNRGLLVLYTESATMSQKRRHCKQVPHIHEEQ